MSEQNIFIRAGHDCTKEECAKSLGVRISDVSWDQHIRHKAFLCKNKNVEHSQYLPWNMWEWLDLHGFVEVFPNDMEVCV